MSGQQLNKGDIGENAVNEVATNTYLKYWCFPSPKDERGNKKEICDLLILFKDVTIIISVKNYDFKGDYEKYFRLTLDKAISQIQGAERKLFHSNRNIVFNHSEKGEFTFVPSIYNKIHRIIINLNTVPKFYKGGEKTKNNNYVHIYNWFAFLKVVNELDTISDLIDYLKERENVFNDKEIVLLTGKETEWNSETSIEFFNFMERQKQNSNQTVLLSGNELDLLANYLNNNRKFGNILYKGRNEYTHLSLEFDGNWENYISKKEVIRKKEEDNISYFIDKFICKEILMSNDDNRIEIATELLSLSRFERRILGKSFYDFIDKHKTSGDYYMARRYGTFGDLTIGFFVHGKGINLEQALRMMSIALSGYAFWNNYETKKILIIGNNTELTQSKFAYWGNVEKLTTEEEEDLKHNLNVLKWFQNITKTEFNINEYPKN